MAGFGAPLETHPGAEPLYIQIVRRVREAIRNKALLLNEPLPSERELAQEFAVSRVPVREALKTLEFIGAVERVPGKGMVARAVDMTSMLESMDMIISDPLSTLTDLFEVRECIETQAVRLAALRRTNEDLMNIERTLIQMEVEIRMGHMVADTSELFHGAIVKASHNDVLIKIHDFLHNLLEYSRRQTLSSSQRYGHVLDFHRLIYSHVKAQDAVAAESAMREHLCDALHHLQSQLKGPQGGAAKASRVGSSAIR